MCGIAGFIDLSGELEDREATLRAMTGAMYHRGPDGEGFAKLAPAFLGHRRLSIIDVEGGVQPMSTEDGRFTVTYNGEIYNFQELRNRLERCGVRLRTRSDTEVLPYLFAEHGVDMVSQLSGMYAFAIWDNVERSLFLARDRLGIKPVFYWHGPIGFAFASELCSLLRYPHVSRDMDEQALSMYFTLNYVPEPWTAYANVRKLPAGHWLLWKDGKAKVQRYWDLPLVSPEPLGCDEEEVIKQLDERLRRVVGRQMISDVPLGAFLSGGIDSGLVVSYMAELSERPVRTFSLGFMGTNNKELPLARTVAQRYGTHHHELVVQAPDAVDLLSCMVEHFGEPFGDSSCIPTFLVSKLAREHVTVCLSGDGGDETFAGYSKYLKLAAIERARLLPNSLLRAGQAVAGLVDTPKFRGARRMLKRAALPFPDSYLEGVCFLDDGWAATWSESAARLKSGKSRALEVFRKAYRNESPVRSAQYLDIKTELVNDMLTKVDRASMAASLEVRVPLLDNELLEWVNALPVHLKQRGATSKLLLKKLAKRRLSANHVIAPKVGFAMPLSAWLRGPLRDLVYGNLVDKRARTSSWLDPALVASTVKRHMEGVEDHSSVIWSLLFFEIWYRGIDEGARRETEKTGAVILNA